MKNLNKLFIVAVAGLLIVLLSSCKAQSPAIQITPPVPAAQETTIEPQKTPEAVGQVAQKYSIYPTELQERIDDMNLKGGGMALYTVTPDEKAVIYISWKKQQAPTLNFYDRTTGKTEELMSFYADTEGFTFEGWSPSGKKLALVVVNQNDHPDYPEWIKLFVISFEGGKITQKQKYNLRISYACYDQQCGPTRDDDVLWTSDETIKYRTWKTLPYDLEGALGMRTLHL